MKLKGKKTLNLLIEVYGKNKPVKIWNYDCAIIGVEVETKRLIYSVSKCIKKLEIQMSNEEAVDYFYSEIYSNQKYFGNVVFCEDYLINKPNI